MRLIMPTYCYSCRHGHVTERRCRSGQRKKWIKCPECGLRARRDFHAEWFGRRAVEESIRPDKPKVSWALGIHPSEVEKYRGYDRAMGCTVDYVPDGCGGLAPAFTSRKQRRDYGRAHHVHDNDGGYGDP